MTLTDRDKKLVIVLVPVVLILTYWFLLLSPKREEAATLGTQLTQVESERDQAQALVSEAQRTKGDYASDYATVVRLGKAIPSALDMPSLIVQLDEAAKETDIRFVKIATGDRETAPVAETPPPAGGEAEEPASEAGGAPAETAPGGAVEQANEGAAAADAQAGAPATGAPATSTAAPGLEVVPLSFSFQGSFFDLADFFHEMKRFVRIAGDGVKVDGRLMTIDGFTFSSELFPTITAEVEASVYLSPQEEGTAAGATPAGPTTAPASGSPAVPEAPAVTPPVATSSAAGVTP